MSAESLARAQDVARTVIAGVSPEQLQSPTPCVKWSVAELLDHLVGAQIWADCGIRGAEMTDTGEGSAQGDFAAAFDQAAASALAAFEEDGALERTVNPGFGDMPGVALMGMAATDTFTHSWDLAKATGQSTDLAPDLAATLLAQSQASIQDAFRSEDGGIFGLEQSAPEGASSADQLAAFLGRTV